MILIEAIEGENMANWSGRWADMAAEGKTEI